MPKKLIQVDNLKSCNLSTKDCRISKGYKSLMKKKNTKEINFTNNKLKKNEKNSLIAKNLNQILN